MYNSINRINITGLLTFFLWSSICFSQLNIPPEVTSIGRQVFCPGSAINVVEDFYITDEDDNSIEFFYIQISSGYESGADTLQLTGSHPNIITSWSEQEGKLTLSGFGGSRMSFPDLISAVKDVTYSSSNLNIVQEKTFSLITFSANYLPSTGSVYEFVPDVGISWKDAKVAAENRTFYGRRGYLATLASQEEADFAGKQSAGAGWIGGSDEDNEGDWRWVTGPLAGTSFWNGAVNGTSTLFAFWNTGEPNNTNGNEHYAHITDSTIGIPGSWNDLPNEGGTGPFEPKGYIVEYGPFIPELNITSSTSIYLPQITNVTNGSVCESGEVTISAIPSEGVIHWFDTPNTTNTQEIATGNDLTVNVSESTTYYAAISVDGCVSSLRIPVRVIVNQRPTIINTTDDLICSGSAILSATATEGDVYWYETETSTTPIFIGDNFSTPSLTSTTSYYVEANSFNCTSRNRTEIIAVVDNTIPDIELPNDNYELCEDIGVLTVEAQAASNNYTFVWQNEAGILGEESSAIEIREVGDYSVFAISDAGCSSEPIMFSVSSSKRATVTNEDVIIDIATNSILITSLELVSGSYEFAIDAEDGPFQENPYFSNLESGIRTLSVRDKGGCGTTNFQFVVLDFPEFFTPNGDGNNDVWNLIGYDKNNFTLTEVTIFDRFGNILYVFDENTEGWNGIYQGKILPSSTYWYKAKVIDINNNSIETTGKISLIRN